jgi:hypothetical protein
LLCRQFDDQFKLSPCTPYHQHCTKTVQACAIPIRSLTYMRICPWPNVW